MAKIKDRLDHWPRNNAGEVLMKTSEEAIFYGTLIYASPNYIAEIQTLRKKSCFDVQSRCKKKDVNLEHLMGLAVQGQFYRECLEEVERLKNRETDLNQVSK